jgi:CBS-domain-containing membrane protein
MHTTYFLTPRNEVVWTPAHATLEEALERIATSGHTAIPVLDDHARYVKTLTEGDLLRKLMQASTPRPAGGAPVRVADVQAQKLVRALDIDADIGELLARATEQNFIPIVDNRGVFAGIVRRREILEYCASLILSKRLRSSAAPK